MVDKHLSWLERNLKRINVNRTTRMYKHYLAIKNEIRPATENEQKETTYFKQKFTNYHKRTKLLLKIRLVLYLFLYASVIVSVIKTIPFLSFLVDFIQFTNAVIGTTVFIVLVLFLTSKINLHLELMNESLTHLIAIYHKNKNRNADRMMRKLNKTL